MQFSWFQRHPCHKNPHFPPPIAQLPTRLFLYKLQRTPCPPALPLLSSSLSMHSAPRPMAFAVSVTPVFAPAGPLTSPVGKRRPSAGRCVVTAIADKPAANPHLKQVSAGIMRDFLTRRAVHNVLFYFREMRDLASVNWVLKFDKFEVREKNDLFHDGNSFISKMLVQPPVHGEYVQNGPRSYLTRRYPFTIKPSQIARSILENRKQLAKEWEVDLRCVENDNLELQRMSVERILEKDPKILDTKRNLIIDYDNLDDSSPMRSRNFNKLLILSTQHSITRLMWYLRENSNHDYMYLMEFVSRFGALDSTTNFIEELMKQPIEARINPVYNVDPRKLAVLMLELRASIAQEWIQVMKGIPEEQVDLTRKIIEKSINLKMANPQQSVDEGFLDTGDDKK